MTAASAAALFGTMLVLAAAPGPGDFALVTRSLAAGVRHGLLMIAGIVAADILFILAAVSGLAAAAGALGDLFVLVKYLCGIYLVWLGVRAMRPRPRASADAARAAALRSSSFAAGFFITLGDPKAILFYMGLLPAFVDLARVSIADTLAIMLLAAVTVGGVKSVYAVLAGRARRFFANAWARRRLDTAAAITLAGAGVFLLVRG